MTHSQWIDKALDLREALKGLDAREVRDALTSLPERIRRKALTSPYIWGRDKQVEVLTSDADTILLLAGRGFGKNWTGAHWLLDRIQRGHTSTAAVAETAADVRDDMVDPAKKDSGIMDFGRAQQLSPNHKSSKARVNIQAPHGQARIQTYSGDSPDSLRGFSGSAAWIDELEKMRYRRDVWDQINLTLREGASQLLITTTPKSSQLLRELIEDEDVHVVTGDSSENAANLDERFKRRMEKMRGTRLGRQELGAEILEADGDLWEESDFRVVNSHPTLVRICIGLDPSFSDDDGDEAGIVVVGLGSDDNAYVLADLSGEYTTREWGAVTVSAYDGKLADLQTHLGGSYSEDVGRVMKNWDMPRPADVIHAELNGAGDLIEQQLRTYSTHAAVTGTHTSQSKNVRAEPVHHLYQRGLVRHVGHFPELEEQMENFEVDQEDSPDRMDALVWAIHELFDLDGAQQNTADAFKTIIGIN